MIIRGYFAAPVRGEAGDKVDSLVKETNVQIGITVGQTIANAFPSLDLIIPHEHELMIDALWKRGLSSDEILDACCDVLSTCELLLVFTGNGFGAGMQREVDFAEVNNIRVLRFNEWNDYTRERIARTMFELGEQNESISD